MKRSKVEIKKRIAHRMNDNDRKRIYGDPNARPKPINVGLISRHEQRTGIKKYQYVPHEIKDYGEYVREADVDYDALIYISSYNRYEKVLSVLNALYDQSSDYTFKVILMNDGSIDKRYDSIKYRKKFINLSYLKNIENGGRLFYWRTTNAILNEIKKHKTHAVIQIDDDFILCNNFVNILMNKFFELKIENNSYMGIRYHIGSFSQNEIFNDDNYDRHKNPQSFDGGSLFDIQFLELINFKIKDEITDDVNYRYRNSHVWGILNEQARLLGVMVYTIRKSLALHDGGTSKMHPEQTKREIHTKNYIGDE